MRGLCIWFFGKDGNVEEMLFSRGGLIMCLIN